MRVQPVPLVDGPRPLFLARDEATVRTLLRLGADPGLTTL